MQQPNWDELDLEALEQKLRNTLPPAEAEKMIWCSRAPSVARVDGDLLRYLLGVVASLVDARTTPTPRAVFEAYFRRSVTDEEWRDRYAESPRE